MSAESAAFICFFLSLWFLLMGINMKLSELTKLLRHIIDQKK